MFARKCISGGESSKMVLEQKVPVFVDFIRVMIERAFPKSNSQKHRLNLLDILGSCSNTKFLFFRILWSNVYFRKEILKNGHLYVIFACDVPALLPGLAVSVFLILWSNVHFRKEILKTVIFTLHLPTRFQHFCQHFWPILRNAQKKCVFHLPVRGDPGVVHTWEHSNPTRVDKNFPTEHLSFVFGTDQ